MQIYHSMDHLPGIPFPVVTVGSFDGVHVGHRKIISRLNELAGKVGGASVLVTFHPHPRSVLYPDSNGRDLKMIYDQEEKCSMLSGTGLDHLVILEFTRSFARTTSEEFMEKYLLGKLKAHTIVVGFNHYFGYNRTGNYDSLFRMSETRGFRVEEIPAQEIQHETVSSTKIRKALSEGNIQRANAYLEHHFIMQAVIIRRRIAPELPGYLCLEIMHPDKCKLIPPAGTYAIAIRHWEENRKGMLLIRPDGRICVYAATDCFPVDGKRLIIHFYKGMTILDTADLQMEMDAIRELVY
ncbi:MAG TPA: FAD synthetase family protein [Bacteroides sp.]|nr:FAD synthetase family protein [Bacteroides sp.]